MKVRSVCSGLSVAFASCLLLPACSSSDPAAGAAGSSSGGSSSGGSSSGGSSSGGSSSGGSSSGGTFAVGGTTGGGGKSSGGASSGGAASGGALVEGGAEPAAQKGMTAAHNAARAGVMPAPSPAIPKLTWSADVAAAAQAWADQCKFDHSGGKYGENIYAASGSSASPANVVSSWIGEAKDYDYAANHCNGVCGHYTQVVWRASTKLGCGMKVCTVNSPFSGFPTWQLWVCNYDPPGNFNGQKPY